MGIPLYGVPLTPISICWVYGNFYLFTVFELEFFPLHLMVNKPLFPSPGLFGLVRLVGQARQDKPGPPL